MLVCGGALAWLVVMPCCIAVAQAVVPLLTPILLLLACVTCGGLSAPGTDAYGGEASAQWQSLHLHVVQLVASLAEGLSAKSIASVAATSQIVHVDLLEACVSVADVAVLLRQDVGDVAPRCDDEMQTGLLAHDLQSHVEVECDYSAGRDSEAPLRFDLAIVPSSLAFGGAASQNDSDMVAVMNEQLFERKTQLITSLLLRSSAGSLQLASLVSSLVASRPTVACRVDTAEGGSRADRSSSIGAAAAAAATPPTTSDPRQHGVRVLVAVDTSALVSSAAAAASGGLGASVPAPTQCRVVSRAARAEVFHSADPSARTMHVEEATVLLPSAPAATQQQQQLLLPFPPAVPPTLLSRRAPRSERRGASISISISSSSSSSSTHASNSSSGRTSQKAAAAAGVGKAATATMLLESAGAGAVGARARGSGAGAGSADNVDAEDESAAATTFDPSCARETAAFSRCVDRNDDLGRCDAQQRLYMQCQRIADEIENPGGGSGRGGRAWSGGGGGGGGGGGSRNHNAGGAAKMALAAFDPRTSFAFRATSERARAKAAVRACVAAGVAAAEEAADRGEDAPPPPGFAPLPGAPKNFATAGCPQGMLVQPLGLPMLPPIPGPFGINFGAIGGVILACIINGVMGNAIRNSVQKVAVLIAKIIPPVLHLALVAGVFDPMVRLFRACGSCVWACAWVCGACLRAWRAVRVCAQWCMR
jgi:hypothetical protein